MQYIGKDFFIKLILRILHVSSFIIIGGYYLFQKLFDISSETERSDNAKTLLEISTVVAIITGLINYILFRTFKPYSTPKVYKLWASIVHLKLLLTCIVFTPLIKLVLSNNTVTTLRLSLIAFFVIASSSAKALRELSYRPSNYTPVAE